MLNIEAANLIAGQHMVGLVVRSEFITEGLMRRPGEVLPATGTIAHVIASGIVEPLRRGTQQSLKQCTKPDCHRRFVDQETLVAHQARDHDPRWLKMREALAAGLDPEPVGNSPDTPPTPAEAAEAAAEIIPPGAPLGEE